MSKNGHSHSFEVDAETASLLDLQAAGRPADEPLFYCRRLQNGKRCPLGAMTMQRTFREVARRAKVPGSDQPIPGNIYNAKHTCCSFLCRYFKGDLRAVMRVTGHRSVQSLMRYIQTPDDRKDVIAYGYNAIDATGTNGTSMRELGAFVRKGREQGRVRDFSYATRFPWMSDSSSNETVSQKKRDEEEDGEAGVLQAQH